MRSASIFAVLAIIICGCRIDSVTFTQAGKDSGVADTVTDTVTDAPSHVTLTVMRTGPGTVTSTPAGINCGTSCSQSVTAGTSVELTATPDTDARFLGWSGGGCSGTAPCTVTVNSDTTVQAMFAMNDSVVVTMSGNGMGSVTSNPAGITCSSGTCMHSYLPGTVVTLTAMASTGTTFTGWSGACTGTGTCMVTVNAVEQVTATFTLNQYTLNVTRTGSGSGTVMSSPSGINCGIGCSGTFNYGTSITLTATPGTGVSFTGWSGDCTGTGQCTLTITSARNVSAVFTASVPRNYMFVTSTTTTGNLGGLAGADSICQARAQAANLPGTYRAWLSTTTVDAYTRLGTASGWIRTDGKPFANTIEQVRSSLFYYPPRLDENGTEVPTASAFTATTVDGVYASALGGDCGGWTSTAGTAAVGFTSSSGYQWTVGGGDDCTTSQHIYCFAIDNQASATPPQPVGVRRAFMMSWASPASGIASADSACQSAAQGSGLPGTYKALLATNGASALSRFSLGGAPWYRVDDVGVLPTAGAWATASYFDANPNLTVDGSMTFGNSSNWAGAASLTTSGSALSTCNNWMDSNATAYSGNANRNRVSVFFGTTPVQCNNTLLTITCLQE